MKKVLLLGVLLISLDIQAQIKYPKHLFSSPLEIPLILSGNFGEIRSDHFHSGIDFKTRGVTGHKIFAVADGHVSRIKIQSGGYGKALYIEHDNGYTSVYGHMEDFSPELSHYTKDNQYRLQQHEVNLFPEKNLFPVKQGDFIGYSGNTGSSSGPYLHFEIRETAEQKPINGLFFNFDVKDNISPVFKGVYFYPMENTDFVNNSNEKTRLIPKGSDNNYYLPDEIRVHGKFGIGVEVYDYLNYANNRCGIYTLTIQVNNEEVYRFVMDGFLFSQSRYINSHIDYEERLRYNRNVHKTFILPNNRLPLYQGVKNNGIFHFDDDTIHQFLITATDVHGNASLLRFNAKPSKNESPKINNPEKDYTSIMTYNIDNYFKTNDVNLIVPSGALYDNIYFTYAKTPLPANPYSELFHIHDLFIPLHKHITLRIKPAFMPAGVRDKALMGFINEKNEKKAAGGKWKDGFIELKTRSFGRYYVTVDTVPPTIQPLNFSKSQNLNNIDRLIFKVKDDFSGIAEYTAYIDNEWVLLEYDPKNDLMYYIFDDSRLSRGQNHLLEVFITDNKNNTGSFHCSFFR
ncbi:MAG: M23 family metallopeptidase [Bacteroidota bacterium]